MIRVRIAPSPTGIPHIGNTRTALFNFLFARHNNGEFLLRIEDTDQARLVPESEKAIYEILEWLGLKWDGKVIKQSQRLEIYKEHAEQLLAKGLAYKEESAIRFEMPREGETSWDDLIGNKHISFKNENQEDFIIMKSDGYPTYNFANVIDDHLMEISHVIRGEEFISSTPKHIRLYKAFGWDFPQFAHLPIILGPDKTKLSKRHGAKSVLDYRDEGYLKEAIINFMVFLGWNPGGEKEVLSLVEMIKFFDLKDVNTNSPIFNIDKLLWFNSVYIRKLSTEKLAELLKNHIYNKQSEFLRKDSELYNNHLLFNKIVQMSQTRISTLREFFYLADAMFFSQVRVGGQRNHINIVKDLENELNNVLSWKKDYILESLKKVLNKHRIKMSVFYDIFTGGRVGLPLPESLEILGKEKVLERLRKAREV